MNMNVANMNVAAIAPSTKGNKTMKAKQAPVLTAEELAMQTAKNAVQTARKEYTKEVNEFLRTDFLFRCKLVPQKRIDERTLQLAERIKNRIEQ